MKFTRHWLAYVCEAIIDAGEMPAWEAVPYFCDQLFGERPNPRLLQTTKPYEASVPPLQRLYRPIVEATFRDIQMPASAMLHGFTDVSLTGTSAVLIVYFPGQNRPYHLLLLDSVKTWDLVFQDTAAFNEWAEERANWVAEGLRAAIRKPDAECSDQTLAYRVASLSGS